MASESWQRQNNEKLIQKLQNLAETGITVSKEMYVKVWASVTNSLLMAGTLEDWVATLFPKVDPPAGRGRAHFPAHLLTEVPDERIEAMVQEHIMNCLLGLLRVALSMR